MITAIVSVRSACAGSGRPSGRARLWLNTADADSDVVLGREGSEPLRYYLSSLPAPASRGVLRLIPEPPPGPLRNVDVPVDDKSPCPGRPFIHFVT